MNIGLVIPDAVSSDQPPEPEMVDISEPEFSYAVIDHVQALYYEALLASIQGEAKKFGGRFVKVAEYKKGDRILPDVKRCLIAAMQKARIEYLYPKLSEADALLEFRQEESSGFAEKLFDDLMFGLNLKKIVFEFDEGSPLKALSEMNNEIDEMLKEHRPSFLTPVEP